MRLPQSKNTKSCKTKLKTQIVYQLFQYIINTIKIITTIIYLQIV